MSSDIKGLIARGEFLFGQRGGMLNFWQDSAEHFFPERAQFTASKSLGDDFADHLQTSYPLKLRRELGNSLSAMLRPRGQQWGEISIERDDRLDSAGRQWLERATALQWRVMYDEDAQFVRATKEGDHDFATFGQCVITRDINWDSVALLYRCWHLKDCAWAESATGQINELHINWRPTVQQLVDTFKGKVHDKIKRRLTREPFALVNCRRILIPSENYMPLEGRKATTSPYLSIYLDLENNFELECTPRWNKGFTIPRWQTISGSAYAYSPAVIASLPDARLIQDMTLTLLEAGELATRPALLGNQDLIRSDVNYFPGGVTWAHVEHDQKLAEALQPLFSEKNGMQFGIALTESVRKELYDAWYLNKLSLPPIERTGEMTAYETRERISDWIRAAIPLFEPMEVEYNGDLCTGTFQDLMKVGAFGPDEDIPDSLKGEKVKFRFESPLHENIERKNAQIFLEAKGLVVEAMELDQTSVAVLKTPEGLREGLRAIGVKAKLIRDEEEVRQIGEEMAEAREQQAALAQLETGAGAAEKLGKAKKALAA